MPDLDRRIFAALVLVAATFALGGAVCWHQARELRSDTDWVVHTQEVARGVGETLAALSQAESSQRSYVLIGDEPLLEPYRRAAAELPARLDALAALTRDNARQQERIAQLRGLVQERLAVLERGRLLRRDAGLEAAQQAIRSGQGAGLMARTRALGAEIAAEEQRLLGERQAASRRGYLVLQLAIGLVALLGLAMVALAAAISRRGLAKEHAAAARLDQQRERYRTTLASIRDGVIATDADGRIDFMNPAAETLTGWTFAEGAGKPLAEVFEPLEESTHTAAADRAGDRRLLRARDGRSVPIDASDAPVSDAAGSRVGAVHVFRDIAERRRRERELAERTQALDRQRELLRVTLTSIGDGVITTDATGRIVFLNPVAEALTGWPQADAVGRPLAEIFRLVNEFSRQHVDDPVATVLREGVIVGLANHTVLIARDGSTRPIEDSAAPIRDADGTVCGVVLVFHDASESREAQAALRESAKELRGANLRLEEADRRKDEFLATLAHELRNPLAPLRTALELLGRPALDAAARERARETMLRQVRQMTRLIDELMDVSRIGSGKLELRREVLDVRAIVDAALEIARPLIDQHGHALALRLPPQPIHVWMDRTRAAQVLSNLLNNAAKYTPAGGHIALEVEADGESVTIAVSDDGEGIGPELLPRIFDMFVQGERANVQSHGGLGVGLSLARRLVELHDGTLEAFSEGHDRGSRFEIRVPVLPAARMSDARGDETLVELPPAMRVLVVDDNQEAADVLGELLRELGATVQVVYGGQPALDLIATFEPKVVLLDIGMPGMDGHHLAREIRARPEGRKMLLIAISGWNTPADRRRSMSHGIDHHVPKPTDIEELARLIATHAA